MTQEQTVCGRCYKKLIQPYTPYYLYFHADQSVMVCEECYLKETSKEKFLAEVKRLTAENEHIRLDRDTAYIKLNEMKTRTHVAEGQVKCLQFKLGKPKGVTDMTDGELLKIICDLDKEDK